MSHHFIRKMLAHRIVEQDTQHLDLRSYEIDDDIMNILFEINTQTIVSLVLEDNLITWQGLINMSIPNWASLTHLDLNNNKIGSKGCKYLSRVHLSNVEQVFLRHNEIAGQGLLHLSKTQWPALQHIQLHENNYKGDRHLTNLTKSNWTNLTDIIVQGKNILNIVEVVPLFLMPQHCIERIVLAWNNQGHQPELDPIYQVLEEKFGYQVIRLQ